MVCSRACQCLATCVSAKSGSRFFVVVLGCWSAWTEGKWSTGSVTAAVVAFSHAVSLSGVCPTGEHHIQFQLYVLRLYMWALFFQLSPAVEEGSERWLIKHACLCVLGSDRQACSGLLLLVRCVICRIRSLISCEKQRN